MQLQVIIAGGGIGGLAAAITCRRAGAEVQVYEQAEAFHETGAGIQLGPNAMRVLRAWGLGDALDEVTAAPDLLRIFSAVEGRELARMPLGDAIEKRYGAPYRTVHRGDLHRVLLQAASFEGAHLMPGSRIDRIDERGDAVVAVTPGVAMPADAIVAADGIWSRLRDRVASDGEPRETGHVAFRALAPIDELPPTSRTPGVMVWLGHRMHVVAYPVRNGEWLNMVALVEAARRPNARSWDEMGTAAELRDAVGDVCGELRLRLEAMPSWRVWTLHDREPVRGPGELARGRIALLGDAAHPMLPYLAQGAGMALEDAHALGELLRGVASADVPDALQRYARARWERVAKVQATARRNATVFHASGPLAWLRDTAMAVRGERLLDQPWLYS